MSEPITDLFAYVKANGMQVQFPGGATVYFWSNTVGAQAAVTVQGTTALLIWTGTK